VALVAHAAEDVGSHAGDPTQASHEIGTSAPRAGTVGQSAERSAHLTAT